MLFSFYNPAGILFETKCMGNETARERRTTESPKTVNTPQAKEEPLPSFVDQQNCLDFDLQL
ncbi:hypothetical protein GCM10008938_32870 [Deinococcus roseus]|uniref:Uncharacterized protein n=1 Tax=Deinococcus roseus TaxID=392414 RepID=A0ABQ2D4I7_9DEIO|nr:hypothetical protein GCM10008938_32870 [Deinococcus roseus]